VDQDLGGGFQLQVNVNGTHSLSKRGLSNNDNSGTSPFLVFPFTPNFIDLLPTTSGDSLQPADFPNNPFERSNPLQTFEFLKNDEDVWRLLGTTTLRWTPVRTTRSNLQLIGIGGVDYFQQDNNFVSPPELQFEPNDGQPGTVVLSKSSNRNLNLALNATHNYVSGEAERGTQFTTSAGIQYEERRLFATQILGRTLLTGQTSPQQAASQTVLSRLEPVRDLGIFAQEEVLLADRRLLLTAGMRADRSSANGNPDKFFFYPKFAASYIFQRPFGGLDEIKFRGAYGQTGNRASFGALFSPDTSGTIGGSSGTFIGTRAGDPGQWAGPAHLHRLPEEHPRPAAGADPGAVFRPGEPDLQLGQPAPKPGTRGLAHSSAGAEQGCQLDSPDHLLRQQEQDHPPRRAHVPDRWLRPLAGHLPDRTGQLPDPDLRAGRRGRQ
jgi:hypothetical protein